MSPGSVKCSQLVRFVFQCHNCMNHSYFIRIIDEWNSLPNDIKETVGVSSFKHKVMSFLSNTYT